MAIALPYPHHTPRFHLDPSGTYTRYDAKAIGSGSEGAQTSLQEMYHKVSMCGVFVHYDYRDLKLASPSMCDVATNRCVPSACVHVH